MTKDSRDSQMESFIKNLGDSPKSTIVGSEDVVAFAGNSAEIKEDERLEKSDFEKLAQSANLESEEVMRGAMQVFRKEFLSFFRVNFILSVSFLLLGLIILLNFGTQIHNFSAAVFKSLPLLQKSGLKSILPIAVFIFAWIFLCYLRASYLAVASNYFSADEHFKPLRFGFQKLCAFMLIELMQVAMFFIGIILLFFAPLFATKYFISLPAMVYQNDSSINAMFESREYVRDYKKPVMNLMFFITFLTFFLMMFLMICTNFLIDNRVIFAAVNFLVFSCLILPLHCCFRFLVYEKLRHKVGELRFEIDVRERIWFVVSRLSFLGLLIFNIFLAATGAFKFALLYLKSL